MNKSILKNKRICFLGTGNMAESLISGLIESKISDKKSLTATDIRSERLKIISKKFKIAVSTNNIAPIKSSDIIIIAVKPKQIDNLLLEIKDNIKQNQLVISIATGITTKHINNYLPNVPVIRIMPNTPALVGEGVYVLCKGKYARRNHLDTVVKMLYSIGTVMVESEKMMNAVTAISGSGPAYVFYLAESMIKTAKELGFNNKKAEILVNNTICGAGKMLKTLSESPEILRNKVTSPGGTTECAIKYFEKNNFSEIINKAINLAKKRAQELTK